MVDKHLEKHSDSIEVLCTHNIEDGDKAPYGPLLGSSFDLQGFPTSQDVHRNIAANLCTKGFVDYRDIRGISGYSGYSGYYRDIRGIRGIWVYCVEAGFRRLSGYSGNMGVCVDPCCSGKADHRAHCGPSP
eukprot:gene24904-biopygen2199